MKTWAIVRNGIIENVCLWDGVSQWQPPEGCESICIEGLDAKIGDAWDGVAFASPTVGLAKSLVCPSVSGG